MVLLNALVLINLDSWDKDIEVVLGYFHVCMKIDNGKVKCFGNNEGGQLGYEDSQNSGLLPSQMGNNLMTGTYSYIS